MSALKSNTETLTEPPSNRLDLISIVEARLDASVRRFSLHLWTSAAKESAPHPHLPLQLHRSLEYCASAAHHSPAAIHSAAHGAHGAHGARRSMACVSGAHRPARSRKDKTTRRAQAPGSARAHGRGLHVGSSRVTARSSLLLLLLLLWLHRERCARCRATGDYKGEGGRTRKKRKKEKREVLAARAARASGGAGGVTRERALQATPTPPGPHPAAQEAPRHGSA